MYLLHFYRDANYIYAVPLYFVIDITPSPALTCRFPFTAENPSVPTQPKPSASSSEASSPFTSDCLAPTSSSLLSGKSLLFLFNAFRIRFVNSTTDFSKVQEVI